MRTGWLLCFVVIAASSGPALGDDGKPYGTIAGWGEMIDPDRDCLFAVGADQVGIQIPGTSHDLSAELNRTNAPRVLQPVEGDFEIEVRVAGTLTPDRPLVATRTAYSGAGLLLMRDEANYIRLERAALRRGGMVRHYLNFEQRQDGNLRRFGRVDDYELTGNEAVTLKLTVENRTVIGWVRTGDTAWHRLGEKTVDQSGMPLGGIAAINVTNTPLIVEFHDFRITPLEPDDSADATRETESAEPPAQPNDNAANKAREPTDSDE